MQDLSGSVVKGYELRECIGSGGFGAVYRAYQSSIGREVAVKIILPRLANHPEFIRRFETEAQLIARLEHPHIIPLHDYWRDPGGAYLVMRWLRGGSLADALRGGPFDIQAAALLLDQVTSALALAHRNQVIHRDLKPANVLMDEDGNAYLADFGIAKDLGGPLGGGTQADAVIGSPDYLSPEQARSEPVSPQTDIYSLGVMLCEVLTGQHPFPGITPVERMYKHLNDPLPVVTTLPPEVAEGVNAVIQKATAKNPANRYADAQAMALAYREAARLNPRPVDGNVVESLTRREQEILQRIMAGQSNKQIAQDLVVTLSTVKWYVRQVYGKLHVQSRVQAMMRARELNLITNGAASGAAAPLTGVTVIPTDQFAPENPYKGLRAFQAADSRDFFGREALTNKLVKRLGETGDMARFLAVIGPSGSGKSSLVKAGLVPALGRGALPGSEHWFVVEMLPGAHPLDELEVALTRIAANQSGNLREHLQRDERGLLRVTQLILPNDGSQLALIIDQFEEVFTLLEDEAARVHFLNMLHEAVADPRSRVRVIVTLRADFYDRPLLYPEFGELVRSRMETVLPLSAEELERAIAQPAERVGVKFEAGLVTSIVSEVNYQPGALPLMQYALTELFEQRQGHSLTHEAYQAIGGTVGALARRADEIYAGLDADGQESARQMFLRLVTLGEGVEDTRRRVPRSELMAIAADEDTMDDLIDTYAAYRLLSLDHDPATRSPTVEVAHEAILREWKRLRAWLNDSRHDIRLQRLLATAAAEWFAANRDDSFLLRGSRLDQFQTWAADTKLAMTPKERDYFDASIVERERQAIAEQKRQLREAALERRSRDFLRGLVAVLLLATLGALGLTAVAVNQGHIAQQNAAIADRNAAEAQNVALISGSQAALANGNTDQAIALSLQAVTLDPLSAKAQVALGEAAYAPGTIRRLVGHTDAVISVAFSPDGRTALSGSADKTLILWDVASGAIIRRFTGGHTGDWIRGVFSPDGRTALSGSADKTLILWDVASGAIIRRFTGHTDGVKDVAFSPDGQTVLSASDDKSLILWDVASGAIIRRLTGHTDKVNRIAFSPDGQTVLSGSDDKTLILWDIQTGQVIRRFGVNGEGHVNQVTSVAISPDGRTALSGARDLNMIQWDMATGQVIRRFYGFAGDVAAVAFSPDGRTALSGVGDATLTLWNVATGQVISHLRGHEQYVISVAISPDGRHALSGSSDRTIRLWDLEEGQVIRRFAGHKSTTKKVALSPDGRTALSGSTDVTAILWDVQTGKELRRFTGTSSVPGVALSPDGRTALLGTGFNSTAPSDVILWDVETGQEIRRFVGHPGGVNYVQFSPDGRTALSGGEKGITILWDVATGREIRRFRGYESNSARGATNGAAFSPDGRTVLSGFGDGTIILWDVATGQEMRRFVGHTNVVSDIAFSPDGHTALSGAWDNTAILWDVATGAIIHRLTDHSAAVYKPQFSPDGRTGFAGSADNSSTLWDLTTGQVIRRFNSASGGVLAAAFGRDGRSVLVGFSDGSLALWRIDSSLDDLLAWTYANRYVPELTCEQRALYRLKPGCDTSGTFPTSTPPLPTWTPVPTGTIPPGTAFPTLTPPPVDSTATP